MADTDFQVVYIARDPLEASAVTGLLEAEGIESRVRDMTISPYPVSFGPLGERHILVPEERLAQARALLDRARRDGFLPADGIVRGAEPAD
jgi:hypothetical protein